MLFKSKPKKPELTPEEARQLKYLRITMASGALISCVLWALFRGYPIYSEAYIERSDNVEAYIAFGDKGKPYYRLAVTVGDTVYNAPVFAKLDLEAPEDFTEKDYYFDTKVSVRNHACYIESSQKKYCTNAMFYDGYFYSYKYDRVFRIYKTAEEQEFSIFLGIYGNYILFIIIFFWFYRTIVIICFIKNKKNS